MISPEKPFDPAARHVDPETGLEYENAGSWLCREAALSKRNAAICSFRGNRYPEHAIRAYWQAYDAVPNEVFADKKVNSFGISVSEYFRKATHADRAEAGIKAGKATGCWGPLGYGLDIWAQNLTATASPNYAASFLNAVANPKSAVKITTF